MNQKNEKMKNVVQKDEEKIKIKMKTATNEKQQLFGLKIYTFNQRFDDKIPSNIQAFT